MDWYGVELLLLSWIQVHVSAGLGLTMEQVDRSPGYAIQQNIGLLEGNKTNQNMYNILEHFFKQISLINMDHSVTWRTNNMYIDYNLKLHALVRIQKRLKEVCRAHPLYDLLSFDLNNENYITSYCFAYEILCLI